MKSLRTAAVALAALATLTLTACTNDLTDVDKAQAQVASKQKAVDEASTNFDQASATFCSAAELYITALDRYGDILHATAPTVGDVRGAGKDLAAPQDQALEAAQTAVLAQSQLVEAKQELADAEAALAAAQAGPSGTPSITPTAVTPAAPLAPEASVDRVKQAEQEFKDTQEGITDDTLLRDAAEPFHSAAVALELSWIRLLFDTGCATDEQVAAAQESIALYTTALQTDLAALELYKGPIDGIYGPQTTQAVADLQTSAGLPATGTMDIATEQALRKAMVDHGLKSATDEIASTAVLQQLLALLGYWEGAVDGIWSDELTEAVKDFQADLGVEPTGEVDAATIAAFQQALEDAKASLVPDEPVVTPSPSPSPSPTV